MTYQFRREPLNGERFNELVNACQSFEEKLVVWTLLDTGERLKYSRRFPNWRGGRTYSTGRRPHGILEMDRLVAAAPPAPSRSNQAGQVAGPARSNHSCTHAGEASSPYWYVKYPDGIREIRTGKHAGMTKRKYRVESTHQTSLRQAQLLAQEIDLKLFKGQMGLCTGRTVPSGLRSAYLVYQKNDTDNRHRHIRDLRGRTKTFVEWASGKGVRLASAVTLEHAEHFVRHLRHELGLQERTIHNYITSVGSMFASRRSLVRGTPRCNASLTGTAGGGPRMRWTAM